MSSSISNSLSIAQNNPRRSSRIANMEQKGTKPKGTFDRVAQSHKTNKISPQEASVRVQPHSDVDIKTNINVESKVEDGKIPSTSDDYNASPKQHPTRNSNVPQTAERNRKEKLKIPKSNDPVWKELSGRTKPFSAQMSLNFPQTLLNDNSENHRFPPQSCCTVLGPYIVWV